MSCRIAGSKGDDSTNRPCRDGRLKISGLKAGVLEDGLLRHATEGSGSPIADVPVGDPATRKHGAALKLFEQLEIEYIPSRGAHRFGPRSTCCGNVVNRLILKHDIELPPSCCARSWRAGNEGELIGDVIGAISDS